MPVKHNKARLINAQLLAFFRGPHLSSLSSKILNFFFIYLNHTFFIFLNFYSLFIQTQFGKFSFHRHLKLFYLFQNKLIEITCFRYSFNSSSVGEPSPSNSNCNKDKTLPSLKYNRYNNKKQTKTYANLETRRSFKANHFSEINGYN